MICTKSHVKNAKHTSVTTLEQEIAFERERLLNLIDSRIRRNEFARARAFAEELFRAEVEFAVRRKTRRYGRYNRILLHDVVLLIGIFLGSLVCMVLNIKPVLCLLVATGTIGAIFSMILFNALLMKRFERLLRNKMERYENLRQVFIEMLLGTFATKMDVDHSLSSLFPALMRWRGRET